MSDRLAPADRPPDLFPRAEAGQILRHLPAYGRLAYQLARDARIPRARRAAVVAAAAYLVSPIDLVPGFIPVLGQLDDILVAIAAIRLAMAALDPAQRVQHLARAGLTPQDLESDAAAAAEVAKWAGRTSARIIGRGVRTGSELAGRGLRAASVASGRALDAGARATGRTIRSAAGTLRRVRAGGSTGS